MLTCVASNPTLEQTASAEKRLLLQCKNFWNIDNDKDNDKHKHKVATKPTLGQTASAEKRLLLQCKIDSLNIDNDKDSDKDKHNDTYSKKYSDKDKDNDKWQFCHQPNFAPNCLCREKASPSV